MGDARAIPLPDEDTAFFWEGAARGELLILHCDNCDTFVHPPRPGCPRCGAATSPKRVSGKGAVHTYTITHRPIPGFEPPFAVVLVDLDDAPGVRLVSNLTDVAPDQITIGMRVEVTFETHQDVALPLFRKAST